MPFKIPQISTKLFFIFLPIALACLYVYTFAVNCVYGDDLELLHLMKSNDLSLKNLFAQHNEHRVFTYRILTYLIYKLTNINTIPIVFISLTTLMIVYFLSIYHMNKNQVYEFKYYHPLIIGFLLFYPAQYGALFWVITLSIYLAALFSLLAMFCYLRISEQGQKGKPIYLALAISFAVLASFSSSQGLFCWPAVTMALILSRQRNLFKDQYFYIWIAAAALTYFLYFKGYIKPGHHPSLSYALSHPIEFIRFFFGLLGGCLTTNSNLAVFWGLLLTLAYLFVIIDFVKSKSKRNFLSICLILYGLGINFSIAISRSGFGFSAGTALASRYTSITILSVLGLFLYLFDRIQHHKLSQPPQSTFCLGQMARIFIIGAICLQMLISLPTYIQKTRDNYDKLNRNKFILQTFETQPLAYLRNLYPSGEAAYNHASWLKASSAHVFATLPNPVVLMTESNKIAASQPASIIDINSIRVVESDQPDDRYLLFSSWAVDVINQGPADSVYIDLGGHKFLAFYGQRRPDVAKHFNNPNYLKTGFERAIPLKLLKNGRYRFKLQVLSQDKINYYEIDSGCDVIIEDGQAEVVEANKLAAISDPQNAVSTQGQFTADVEPRKVTVKNDAEVPMISFRAWGRDPFSNTPADSVYVCLGDLTFRANYRIPRPDVAKAFNNQAYLHTGFSLDVPIKKLPDGRHHYKLKILTGDKVHYYEVDSKVDIVVENGQARVDASQ